MGIYEDIEDKDYADHEYNIPKEVNPMLVNWPGTRFNDKFENYMDGFRVEVTWESPEGFSQTNLWYHDMCLGAYFDDEDVFAEGSLGIQFVREILSHFNLGTPNTEHAGPMYDLS